jgi:hypothetical protein
MKKTSQVRQYKYFKLSEFDSPDKKGSGEMMQDSTIKMLDVARGVANIPFVINSGFRTKEHNRRVGGVEDSTHLEGYGVDIRANSRQNFERVVLGLVWAGFRRIGVHHTFVHADNHPDRPQTQWLYERSNLEQQSRLQYVKAVIDAVEFIKSISK